MRDQKNIRIKKIFWDQKKTNVENINDIEGADTRYPGFGSTNVPKCREYHGFATLVCRSAANTEVLSRHKGS